MGILKSIARRAVTHTVLGGLTVITGGATGFLHVLAEKLHFVGDASDALDALSDIGDSADVVNSSDIVDSSLPETNVGHSSYNNVSFGGFAGVESIADVQSGPTCGFEAVENLVQLDNQNVSNSFSDWLQQGEAYDGGVTQEGALNPQHYQHILSSNNIPSHWDTFSHDSIANAVNSDQGVLAIGNAHDLNPSLYPNPEGSHAFVITDTITDDFGNITHYKGVDSNIGGSESIWPAQNIENALNNSGYSQSLLITDRPLNWNV